jgi:hypothetical protein
MGSGASPLASNTEDDNYTVTGSVEMPPSNAFVNIALGQYYKFDDQASADAGILSFRRRLSDGSDEVVVFARGGSLPELVVPIDAL